MSRRPQPSLELPPNDDSSIRCVSGTSDDVLEDALAPIAGVDLMVCLLEIAKVAVFIFRIDGKLVTANEAARGLLALPDFPLEALARSVHYGVVETPSGPLRVSRRELAANGVPHLLVTLAEPFVADSSEIVALATARWQLTTRQAQVLSGVLKGLSNKEIAVQVGASHRTIEVHITALLTKARVDSRGRLVVKARELGLAGASHQHTA